MTAEMGKVVDTEKYRLNNKKLIYIDFLHVTLKNITDNFSI